MHTEIQMNTSNTDGRNAPSANDQFVPVTPELLARLQHDDLRLGDILTTAANGRFTGFWRSYS
jgi:hypothetical protein